MFLVCLRPAEAPSHKVRVNQYRMQNDKAEVFLRLVFQMCAQRLTQHLPVDLAVGKGFGHDGLQFAQAFFGEGEGGAQLFDGHSGKTLISCKSYADNLVCALLTV